MIPLHYMRLYQKEIWMLIVTASNYLRDAIKMTTLGPERAPLQTGARGQRLKPLGQAVATSSLVAVIGESQNKTRAF